MSDTENLANVRGTVGMFSPADVLQDFGEEFLNEHLCRIWVIDRLHPRGPRCPQCNCRLTGIRVQRFWENERIRCIQCNKFFTALTDTFLSGCHMTFRQIVLLAILFGYKIPVREIAQKINVNEETVRLWRKKFK